MPIRRSFAATCVLVLALSSLLCAAAITETEAQSGAEAWLSLIDHRQYAESWAESGTQFRSRVTKAQWVAMAGQARSPLGERKSPRSLLNVTFAKTLPGAPDGDYAVLRFRSTFEHKAETVETVTLIREAGKLKCVGYFIQ